MKVTQIFPVNNPSRWKNGDRLVAFCNVEHSGLTIQKCLLIKKANGANFLQPPKINGKTALDFFHVPGREEAANAAFAALQRPS